jgi:signal transduction histidine kinase
MVTGLEAEMVQSEVSETHNNVESRDSWLRRALHDLCQPLTALDCLLYINREPVTGELLETTVLRNVMEEALVESTRMLTLVRQMQERLTVDTVAMDDLP